eukprot:PhM_4_TR9416/c1_g1_i1/m.12581
MSNVKESIKGFCRRQSQKVGQTYGNADKTRDTDVDNMVTQFHAIKNTNEKIVKAVNGVLKAFATLTDALTEMRGAVATVQTAEPSAFVEELRQFDIAHAEITTKLNNIEQKLRSEGEAPLLKIRDDYPSMKLALEDRHSKKLEFDFFRNKVAELEKSPPKDPERLPRNQAILQKWKADYEAANVSTKAQLKTLLDNARVATRGCVSSYFNAYTSFLNEGAATTRIVLRDAGGSYATTVQNAVSDAAGHAKAKASAAAASIQETQQQIQRNVQQTAASAAAAATGAKHSVPPTEPEPDPFA